MFIAMNRFRVAKGSEAAFEQVWLSRDSHLDKVPGFVEFLRYGGRYSRCGPPVSGALTTKLEQTCLL
jgi:heme-degrading monooxygenase HmoA